MIGWLGRGAVLNTSSSSSVSTGGGGLTGAPSKGNGGRGGACSGFLKHVKKTRTKNMVATAFIFKAIVR